MKIKASVIVRCAVLVIALANQLLAIFGDSLPFTQSVVYQVVSAVITAAVSIYAAWKNNDFTLFARLAGKILEALKDGKLTSDEVEEILEGVSSSDETASDASAAGDNSSENSDSDKNKT